MVDRLAKAYLASGGDLPTVYRALIDSPEAWAPRELKFKNPWDWTVSALRAVGQTTIDGTAAAAMLKQLGQPTWQPGSPAGWDDIAASWAAPEALMRRVEIAQRIANRAGSSTDARALAEKVLPVTLTETTGAGHCTGGQHPPAGGAGGTTPGEQVIVPTPGNV